MSLAFVPIHSRQRQENRPQKQDGQPAEEASHATDTHSASLAHETRPRVLRLHQTQIPQTLQLRRHEPTSGADERKQDEEEEEECVKCRDPDTRIVVNLYFTILFQYKQICGAQAFFLTLAQAPNYPSIYTLQGRSQVSSLGVGLEKIFVVNIFVWTLSSERLRNTLEKHLITAHVSDKSMLR